MKSACALIKSCMLLSSWNQIMLSLNSWKMNFVTALWICWVHEISIHAFITFLNLWIFRVHEICQCHCHCVSTCFKLILVISCNENNYARLESEHQCSAVFVRCWPLEITTLPVPICNTGSGTNILHEHVK